MKGERPRCAVTGKVAYPNRREAQLALKRVQQRRAGFLTEQSYYHCRFCNQWHLTKMKFGPKPTYKRPRLPPTDRWRRAAFVCDDE